jgi:hypothetical protein
VNDPIPATMPDPEPRAALAVAPATPPPVLWTPTFALAVDEMVKRKEAKHEFFLRVMDRGVHFGVIPGTGDKPTLLKPGAEMLLANMGLQPSFFDATDSPEVDILGTAHKGEPYIKYRRICIIYRQLGARVDDRMIVAQAEGSCSSWETKYRYRNAEKVCPNCGGGFIKKSKFDNKEWYCYAKIGGCGATFPPDDTRIVDQVVGKVPNPDVCELENTVLKMADKRALVAATLLATGCSDIFTQDVEDFAGGSGNGETIDYDPNDDPPGNPAQTQQRTQTRGTGKAAGVKVTPIHTKGNPRKAEPAAGKTAPAGDQQRPAGISNDERGRLQAEVRGFFGIKKPSINGAEMQIILADMQNVMGTKIQTWSAVTDAMLQAYVHRKKAAATQQQQQQQQQEPERGMTTRTNNALFTALNAIGVKDKESRLLFVEESGFSITEFAELDEPDAVQIINAATALRELGQTQWRPYVKPGDGEEPAESDAPEAAVDYCRGCGAQTSPQGNTEPHASDCDVEYPDEQLV